MIVSTALRSGLYALVARCFQSCVDMLNDPRCMGPSEEGVVQTQFIYYRGRIWEATVQLRLNEDGAPEP